jgi:hypothetical protein
MALVSKRGLLTDRKASPKRKRIRVKVKSSRESLADENAENEEYVAPLKGRRR